MKAEVKIKFLKVILWGCIISLFCFIPYLTKSSNLLESDIVYHLSRIEGLANSIRETGNLFPKIYNSLFYEQGYAFPTFYCDLFLIFPAILYNLGFSLISSYKLLIYFCNLCTFFSFYYLLRKFKVRDNINCFLSSFYLLSYYRIFDIYYRGALGEILSFIFLPIILVGIYEVIFEKDNGLLNNNLIVGFSGITFSHNISLYLGAFLFFIFLCINVKRLNIKKIKIIIFSTITVVLITGWYVFPMVEQLIKNDLYISSYNNNFLDSFISVENYLYIFGKTSFFSNRIGDILFITSIIIFIITYKNNKKTFIFQTYAIGFLFAILPLKGFEIIVPIFKIIQFPFRFFLISTTLLIFSNCFCLNYLITLQKNHISNLINKFVIVFKYTICFTAGTFLLIYIFLDSPFVLLNIQSKGMFNDANTTYGEILNSSMAKDRCFSNKICLDSGIDDLYLPNDYISEFDNNEIKLDQRIGSKYFFSNIEQDKNISLPIVYYYGYKCDIEYACTIAESNGRVSIQLDGTSMIDGKLIIYYEETIITKLSKTISFITFIVYMILVVKQKCYINLKCF